MGRRKSKLNMIIGIGLSLVIGPALFGGAKQIIGAHHAHTTAVFASGPCPGVGSVPASMINGAAQRIGISCRVVEAQINEESGGQPGAYSPAHAKGVAQFIQSTWDSHVSRGVCAGSPWNVSDAMACYAQYMRELLQIEHGNLRDALAAYNAGTGNLGAGFGYADTILSAAGIR